jgi:hypothetical protein
METIRVVEPRVNVKSDVEKNHVVLYGGLRVNEQVNPADSWGSVGTKPVQAVWTINPPSTQTIIDRQMKIRTYWRVTTDQPMQLGTNDALRQFPTSSMCDVLTVQINGESISDNLSDKLHAMLCYGNTAATRSATVSTTASMPDNYQQYADWTNYGSAKNPLSNYGENGSEDPRGGFPATVSEDFKSFDVVITEPILMSPFLSGFGNQEEGFVNVNQMNIVYRWKSDLSQILSHSTAGNAITSVSVTMYQAPEILTTFITPDLTQPIPQMQVLPYHKSQDYIKTVAPLNNGASTRVISDSIKLSQIPRKLYLFCRHQRSSANQETADSFLRIDGLSVLWNNQSGLFSSATEQDLFEISKRNGMNLSYPQWRKFRGGVFCLEFGKDIGLLDNEAPGVQGQYTVQIQMDVTNVSGAVFTPEFYQIFLMEGTFSIAENLGRASLGNLTQQAVLASKQADELDFNQYETLQGGSFWSSLKSFVNKAARGVQKGVGMAEKIAPAVVGAFPELAPVAAALHTVGSVAGTARGLTGGRMAGGRLAGGRLRGERRSMRRR